MMGRAWVFSGWLVVLLSSLLNSLYDLSWMESSSLAPSLASSPGKSLPSNVGRDSLLSYYRYFCFSS